MSDGCCLQIIKRTQKVIIIIQNDHTLKSIHCCNKNRDSDNRF